MKKTIIFLFFLSIFGLFLVGCSKSDNPQDNLNRNGMRMPDFGQPNEPSDIRGLVTKIVGNEVTVLKIERPGGFVENQNNNSEDDEKKNVPTIWQCIWKDARYEGWNG